MWICISRKQWKTRLKFTNPLFSGLTFRFLRGESLKLTFHFLPVGHAPDDSEKWKLSRNISLSVPRKGREVEIIHSEEWKSRRQHKESWEAAVSSDINNKIFNFTYHDGGGDLNSSHSDGNFGIASKLSKQ